MDDLTYSGFVNQVNNNVIQVYPYIHKYGESKCDLQLLHVNLNRTSIV